MKTAFKAPTFYHVKVTSLAQYESLATRFASSLSAWFQHLPKPAGEVVFTNRRDAAEARLLVADTING